MSGFLDIKGLSFSYGKKLVFSQLNLSASPGDIICLMGPNGCGKTTLIDTVLGLKKPQDGQVLLCKKAIGKYKRHEIAHVIAYVPQIHDMTFPYTVREIVLMGRTSYAGTFGKPSKEDEAICDWALDRVGIGRFADKPYNCLSGGEIKLVLLARALGQKTPLMLLDEPTAHLDYKNELLFLETVVSQCRAEGITAIMSTHAPDHAFYLASHGLRVRAAMMAGGRLAYFGHPDDVITENSILDVYGVKAKILTDSDDSGHARKRVMLLETA